MKNSKKIQHNSINNRYTYKFQVHGPVQLYIFCWFCFVTAASNCVCICNCLSWLLTIAWRIVSIWRKRKSVESFVDWSWLVTLSNLLLITLSSQAQTSSLISVNRLAQLEVIQLLKGFDLQRLHKILPCIWIACVLKTHSVVFQIGAMHWTKYSPGPNWLNVKLILLIQDWLSWSSTKPRSKIRNEQLIVIRHITKLISDKFLDLESHIT